MKEVLAGNFAFEIYWLLVDDVVAYFYGSIGFQQRDATLDQACFRSNFYYKGKFDTYLEEWNVDKTSKNEFFYQSTSPPDIHIAC